MQLSTSQLLDELVALGILPSAAAGDARRSEAVGATTVGALIEKWVSAGRLTPLQAEAIRSGMHRKLLVADYVLLDEIGEGGMGRVYKARHRHMQRLVALKVLCGSSDAEEALLRFQREVEAAARLAHPNIVTAYDAGFVDGEPYLVMEYVDGRSLAEILRGRRPLEISQAVDLILQAARGLAYAHGRGVVHRDVKPSNLLVDCAGTVKILDMGLARLHVSGTETSDEDGLTDSGQILGTVDYMAPEQARNTHQADHRADIYSLGCTLYRCLTGTIPYGGTSSIDKLMAHRELPIPALGEHRPDVPPELEAVYSRMVAKYPDERFRSMNDVLRALVHGRSREGAAGGPSLAAA
ncbi:MAG: serine/threonine protein kinase, partial [Planctomycetes bacterium]|nr:serine/threonine protein kinase [Planctomycetota bacterium]